MNRALICSILVLGMLTGAYANVTATEVKTESLYVRGAKTVAKESLARLREGTTLYEFHIKMIRDEAEKGKFSLEDIGTSEKELGWSRLPDKKI